MRTVILTRPLPSSNQLQTQLIQAGLTVLHVPSLALTPTQQPENETQIQRHWLSYDGVIVVSQHAAQFAHEHMQRLNLNLPNTTWLGAVGQGTLNSLRQLWPEHSQFITPDAHDTQDSEGLWHAITRRTPIDASQRILIIRAQTGRDVLRQWVLEAGAQCDIWACYQRSAAQWTSAEQHSMTSSLTHETPPLFVITSIEGLDALLAQPVLQTHQVQLTRALWVTIHPRIAQYAEQKGLSNVRLCAPERLAVDLPIWARA